MKRLIIIGAIALLTACSVPKQPDTEADPAALVPAEVMQAQQQALAAIKSKRYQTAVGILQPAAEKYPDYSSLYTNLGIAYIQLNQDEEAQAAFNNAVKANPENAIPHNYLGILQRRAGRFAEAKESYQRALSIDKAYSLAHLNLGILCDIYLQDLDCALKHYQAYEDTQTEARQAIQRLEN